MRWRDINHADRPFARTFPLEAVYHHSVSIDRNGSERCSSGEEDPAGGRVARVLDGHPVSRLDYQANDKVQPLLGAAGNDDVFRVAPQTTRAGEITPERHPERLVSSGRTVVVALRSDLARLPSPDARPRRD